MAAPAQVGLAGKEATLGGLLVRYPGTLGYLP